MGNTPNVRFKGFTEDWEQRKLGELAEIVGGGTPSTSVESYWDGDIDWYAPAEIGEQIYLKSSQRKITEEGLNKSSAKVLPVGTVLFTSRAGIGKTAILLKEGCTNQGFQSIVPNKNKLDSYFIFTRSEELKRYGETVGAGSTFVEVSGKQMANMELMMPTTMDEQQKIGEYFSNLDHLITLHQQKCDETKEFKKYMLQNMFPQKDEKVPKIRFDGFTGDWEQRKLNEVAEKICVGFVGTCEKFYTDESGVPMYRTGNLNGLSLNRDDLKYVTNEFHQHNQKSQLKAGDILIARHGDSGKAVNYESSEEANCLNIVIIRPDFKKCNYKFLTNCINSPECQKHIKSLSAGSTQAVINTSEIEKLGVVMPTNIDEQNRIARYFSNLDHLITLHQQKCNALKEFKKYMLQNMFPQKGENKCQN